MPLPFEFANPAGIWGFAALIPLILLYLIRPRPVKIEIPSLMFFLTSRDSSKQQSFLKKITKDWLFLLQLLILILLALHIMEPFTEYEHDITAENTVIVLDISASSQVYEDRQTRFQKGVKFAKEALGGKNTIILAKGSPKLAGTDLDYDDATDILNALQPTAAPSAIGDAMILAGETLNGKEGRVVVISDFINTEGMAPITAKSVLQTKGMVVDMIDTTTGKIHPNVGIVNLEVDDEAVTVFVRNFNEEKVNAEIIAGTFRKEFSIDPLSAETVSFQTPKENTKVQLITGDDFELDNTAYIATPKHEKISVLLITNNDSVFVRNALTTLQEVELEVANPPIVPSGRYDVVVIHQIKPSNILPGTFENIEEHVKDGSNLIISAQSDSDQVNYKDLLPVTRGDRKGLTYIHTEQVNTFTRDLEFGSVQGYWHMENRPGTISIASDGLNGSIIAFQQRGAGKIVYFGIEEGTSDFKLSPSFPIFWVKLVQFMVGQDSITNLNVKTGNTAIF
ncbi:MAG: BatA domain-containing protein, partial [Candidatus Nanoarchaeia archaeon]